MNTSNGEGTMTVIQQESPDQYKVLETVTTMQGARTITIHKASHHLYLSGAEFEPGTGRRPARPDTFKVIAIKPSN